MSTVQAQELEKAIAKLDAIDNSLKWSGHHDLKVITTKAINDLMKVRNELINESVTAN